MQFRRLGGLVKNYLLLGTLLLAFTAVGENKTTSEGIAAHVKEIEKQLENSIVSRATGDELNLVMQCRLQELVDAQRRLFTQKDYAELTAHKCRDNLCVGNAAPFDLTLEKAIQRTDQMRAWLEEQRNEPVKLSSEEKIPFDAHFPTWAKDEEDLKTRWRQLLTFDVMKAVLQIDPDGKRDDIDLKKVQRTTIGYWIEMLDDEKAKWTKMSMQEKVSNLLQARITCQDRYAMLLPPAKKTDSKDPIDRMNVTHGVKFGVSPEQDIVVTGLIPGSKASAEKILRKGDKLNAVVVNGKRYEIGEPKFQSYFNRSHKKGEKLEVEVQRGDKTVTAPLEYEGTIPMASVVEWRDIKVNGRNFRVVSIPDFIFDDPTAKERVGTSDQVERALREPGDYEAIVLDVRSNPGGAAIEARKVAALFLSKQNNPISSVVKFVDGKKFVGNIEMSHENPIASHPLFIFTDGKTASAAEIVAETLQKAGRAVVIGDTSHGKGIEQTFAKLSDGSTLMHTTILNTGLGGDSFHQKGIPPNLRVPYINGTDPSEKEKQKVTLTVDPNESPAPQFTKDFAVIDNEAMERTRTWARNLAAKTPHVSTYYSKLKALSEMNKDGTYPLDLELARKEDVGRFQIVRLAKAMGAADTYASYPVSGTPSNFSLLMAEHYLSELSPK